MSDSKSKDINKPKPSPIPAKKQVTPTTPNAARKAVEASSDSATSSSKPNADKPHDSGKGMAVIAVLLSMAALAGTGFTWYQNQVHGVQRESKLALGVSEIGGQVSRLGDSIARIQRDQANVVTQADLTTRVLELQTVIAVDIGAMQNSQSELNDSIFKINADLNTGVNQYVVDEVSQLLRIANHNVMFTGNIDSATNALTLADNQLKALSDPRYAAVRVIINTEISGLRNVQVADVESISASLHSIAGLIEDLPLANEPPTRAVEQLQAAQEAATSWRTELAKVWRDILNSVSIQRIDQPPKPLLVPQQRYFLNQNIQLRLAAAELALLQGKEVVLQRNIQDAIDWLGDYFDMADPGVTSVVKQLNEIVALPINTKLPSITGSYEALQNIKGGQ